MTDACLRGRLALGAIVWLALGLFTSAAAAAPAYPGMQITVQVDTATLIELPAQATTIVIGNPLIADLSIEPHGLGVITGKGYGATNFIVLNKAGVVLAEHTVEVKGPLDPTVIVYRGATRQTYSCAPQCERRITLGDTGTEFFDGAVDKDYFARTIDQSATRNNQAMGAAASAAQPQH
jgi:hypothetical protein